MVALFYLPVTSPLVCASTDQGLLRAWADGRSQDLIDDAEQQGQVADDPVRAALMFQTCADMCLLHGRCDEADRFYRRSMRRLMEPGDIDTFSCRVAGYQALFHDRLEPAAGCFQRLSIEGNTPEVRLEAMLVLALLFHHAGLFAEAHADLNRMADLAIASGRPPWLGLAHAANEHFAVLARIHSSSEMDGHVQWRSAPEPAGTILRLARLPAAAISLPWDSGITLLLSRREDHVYRLELLSDATHRDTDAWINPLLVRSWGLDEPEVTRPQALVEMSMAALCTRRTRLAMLLLDPVLADHPIPEPLQPEAWPHGRPGRRGSRARSRTKRASRPQMPMTLPPAAPWPPLLSLSALRAVPPRLVRDENIVWRDAPVADARALLRKAVMKSLEQDFVYAVSRLRQQQGMVDESARHYRTYLARALSGLGKQGNALRRSVEAELGHQPAHRPKSPSGVPLAPVGPADDVTRRLPSRYLDAYRYMLEHMPRADLSMREVAEQVHMSERSLQMAFKRYLGETPREVLRRRRLEKIHDELLLRPHSQASLMEVAMRHGVTSRSGLIASYRKYYAQTPTDSVVEANRAAAREEPEPGPVISRADVANSA